MLQNSIKILIVADGIFSFGPQTHDDNLFTLTFLIKSLEQKNGPLDPLNITINTAHRDGEVLYDGAALDPSFPFPKPSFASIPGKFRFAGPLAADESTRSLKIYDQIWFFGYNGVNLVSTVDPRYVELRDPEIVAITAFMNQGGGVFASGDHASLGAPLCGKIPRVRTMRKWWGDNDPNKPASPDYLPNYPGAGRKRADTLMPSFRPHGDLFDAVWDTQNQSDEQPQILHPTNLGLSHPILQTSFGTLRVMPDHQHEGEVCGYGGSAEALPYSMSETLAYVGADFTDNFEYPFRYPPEMRPRRENPQILATGVCSAHPGLTKSKPNGVCNDPFFPDLPTDGIPMLNILCAYDGHAVGVGRVVTDSSFHHYLDLNLLGDPCADSSFASFETTGFTKKPEILEQMAQIYRNLALYLSGPPLIPLVCTGNARASRKAYSLAGNNKVAEFSSPIAPAPPTWSVATLANNSPKQASPLVLWTLANSDKRIYFFDANNRVNELAFSSTSTSWHTTVIAGAFQQSRRDSGLACTGPNDGTPPKVFFINPSGQITQLTSTNPPILTGWTPEVLPGPPAVANSTLTAIYSATDGMSVYYYSSSGIVEVSQSDDPAESWRLNTLINEGAPQSSNIVSLLVNNIPQIFFSDNHQRICSLTLHSGLWNKTILPGDGRLEGTWLTGYVRNGSEPVLYYVARDGLINELAWSATSNAWNNVGLLSKLVRTRSQIECLDFGSHAEVFYTGATGDVNGLMWDATKGWQNLDLLHPFLVHNPGGEH